jgi:arsenate reductase (thioredoxin)
VPQRVLFVCIGNSCRSQMAEGFALRYGKDVMAAESAGVAPAIDIARLTKEVMRDKAISLDDHVPKSIYDLEIQEFHLVVNMSGFPLKLPVPVRDWVVEDPIGQSQEVFEKVRDQIENLVMSLILELRNPRVEKAPEPPSRDRTPQSPRRLRRE